MTSTELKQMLARFGIRPIKDRSQHFLLDNTVVDAMLAAADVQKGERIVEIGPGHGVLTEKLWAAGADVIAAEIDQKLCTLLRERFGGAIRLIEGDALEIPNAEFAAGASAYTVVANVPYAITSPLLKKFLLETPKPSSVTVLVQREVAERVAAQPGAMSGLAVLVQTYAKPNIVRCVAAAAFFPPPKVESAVLHLALRSDAELKVFFKNAEPARYFALSQAAFAEPRKQIKNTLRKLFPSDQALADAIFHAGISPSARPSELALEQWRLLAVEGHR